jgi:hypothetical protein
MSRWAQSSASPVRAQIAVSPSGSSFDHPEAPHELTITISLKTNNAISSGVLAPKIAAGWT